jgi:signal transduction histidine kinase
MGGSIKIETEKGDGTCVTVWLSAEEEDEEGDDG